MSIEQILTKAGGVIEVSYHLQLSQFAVLRWRERGIPEKHWDALMQLGKITLKQLHEANKAVRHDGNSDG